MPTGRFIVIEGIDGAGTTTQTRLLVDWMNERGWRARATGEPSQGPIGRLLREILGGAHGRVDGTAMALLFAADRLDHLAREVEPALAEGVHVVSDRYTHSSLAYQAEEADRSLVAEINRRARPVDLTLLLDLPAEVAAERRARAGRPVERYDDLAVQRRVAARYAELARELGDRERIVVVPAQGSIEEVQARLRREVAELCR